MYIILKYKVKEGKESKSCFINRAYLGGLSSWQHLHTFFSHGSACDP